MGESQAWCVLTGRYGHTTLSPTDARLIQAANDLYGASLADVSEQDSQVACLRFGWDEGPVFVIEATSAKKVALEKYADSYCERIVSKVLLPNVTEQELVELWQALAMGNIDWVKRARPECAW